MQEGTSCIKHITEMLKKNVQVEDVNVGDGRTIVGVVVNILVT